MKSCIHNYDILNIQNISVQLKTNDVKCSAIQCCLRSNNIARSLEKYDSLSARVQGMNTRSILLYCCSIVENLTTLVS